MQVETVALVALNIQSLRSVIEADRLEPHCRKSQIILPIV